MALTAAEHAKRYREKLKSNSITHDQYLQNEKLRYQKRKEDGQLQGIGGKSERGQRSQRKAWRRNTKAFRERERRDQKRNIFLAVNSPPVTPPSVDRDVQRDVQHDATAKTRGRQKV